MNDKNAEVTAAIMEAEDLTRRAVLAWERVQRAEDAIAQDPEEPHVMRACARRGVQLAEAKLILLRQVDRFSRGGER
jgi:hypothetical protein